MVGLLIQMKVTVLRHSITAGKATWMLTGGLLGLAVAAATIAVATLDSDAPGTVMDLLAVVFALWALGWMLGPAFGGEPVLRAEHFALLPVPRVRLAVGLLGAGFVGITTAVTFVAFAALVVFAARLGPVPILVSIPALVLQLALVVLLSRLAARLFGALSRSRTGGAITGMISAALMVLSQSGWIVFIALDTVLLTGFSKEFSLVVRALPTSWGLLAVDASARGDWLWTIGALTALALVVAALLTAWGRLFGPQRLMRPVVRGSAADRAAPFGWASHPGAAAVYIKELRTWLRDPPRIQSLVTAPVFAILTCLLPVLFGSTAFLPFAGAITALMAAVTTSNLYGQDGTALWLTVFGPMSLLLTVAGSWLHGDPALWPWALAATFSMLGGAAGVLLVVATDQLVPGPDPHLNKNSPLDHGDLTGQAFVMLLLAAGTAVPALAVVLAGALLAQPQLAWAGVAVAVLTGAGFFIVLGRTAAERLRTRGPELLYLMRAGAEHQAETGEGISVFKEMPAHRRNLLWTSFFVGAIALFPQAMVPIGMKLSGNVESVWFLALHLPEPLQWPTIGFMVLLGLLAFGFAGWIYYSERRKTRTKTRRTSTTEMTSRL